MMSDVLFSKHALVSAGDTCFLIVVFALVAQFTLPCHCDTSDWIDKPCKSMTPMAAITERPLRHTRNAQDGELYRSIDYFKKARNNLTSLYHMKNVNEDLIKNCLPKFLGKRKNGKRAGLRKQYQALVKYAVAMQRIRDMNVSTLFASFNRAYRNEVFTSAMDQLKRYMCEVREKIEKHKFKAPPLGCLKLPDPLDYTGVKRLDVWYFKKLIKFLKSIKKRNGKNQRRKIVHRSSAVARSRRKQETHEEQTSVFV